MDGFLSHCKKPFRFGPHDLSLDDLLPASAITRMPKKFDAPPAELAVALRELVRFLFLAAHSPRTVFFPGDQLVDDLWHALITETAEYRTFCDRIRPGCFIDHSGIPFDAYTKGLTLEQIHEEQCSWLASYIANFGPIDEEAYKFLLLAQSLAERLGGGLNEVNRLGLELVERVAAEADVGFDYQEYLQSEIAPRAYEIDSSPIHLSSALRKIANEIGRSHSPIRPFTNSHLELLFGESTALAFTLWQHLAVVERLDGLPEWQQREPHLWEALSKADLLCGLATTHLANPNGPTIQASQLGAEYVLNGHAAWVCGKGIFDKLLIGFELGDSVAFAITDFPIGPNVTAIYQQMSCLMGAATVKLELKNYHIPKSTLVSSRLTNSSPPIPRVTQYLIPEIGIAKSCLTRIKAIVDGSPHPKHRIISLNLNALESRITSLCKMREDGGAFDELVVLRDEINRDAVRLLALTLGGAAMAKESGIPRLQLELLLMDSVIQSPGSLELKITSVARG